MHGMRIKSHRNQFMKKEYARKDESAEGSPFWATKKPTAEEIAASPKVIALRRALAMKAAAAKKKAPAKKRLVAKAKPKARKPAKKKARRYRCGVREM